MPDIKIFHCLFDSLNCTHIWKQRKTKLGICLGRVVVFARIEKGKLMLNTHLKNLTCTMKWRGSIFFIFRGSTSILPNIILALLLVRRKSVEIQLPILGLNKSDSTYGWYGQMLGIHLYYNYYTDQVEEESKAISLRKLLIEDFNDMNNVYKKIYAATGVESFGRKPIPAGLKTGTNDPLTEMQGIGQNIINTDFSN